MALIHGIQETVSPNDTARAMAVANALAAQIMRTLQSAPQAVIAVSGGKSPVSIFTHLRTIPLDWSRVVITLVDERWTALNSAASNARLVQEHLLQDAAAAAHFIALNQGEPTADAAQARLRTQYAALSLPFSAVLLGVGEDGHTASLFADSPNLSAALASDAPIFLPQTAPTAPNARLSLTLPWIRHTDGLLIQFSGSAKLRQYQAARRTLHPQWPLSMLLHSPTTPIQVFYVAQ